MKLKYDRNRILLLSIVYSFAVLIFSDSAWLGLASSIIVLWLFLKYLNSLEHGLALIETLLFVNSVQIILGPSFFYSGILEYSGDLNQVDSKTYFINASFAFMFFCLGCLFFLPKIDLSSDVLQNYVDRKENRKWLLVIYVLGQIAMVVSLVSTTSFDFIFKLLGGASITISLVFLFSKTLRWKVLLVGLAYFQLLLQGIILAVFAELIVYLLLMLMFLPVAFYWNKRKILYLMGVGLFVLLTLNSVKKSYRQLVWQSHGNTFDIGLFVDLLVNYEGKEDDGASFIERFSSGLVNSAIYYNVPRNQDHTWGKEFSGDMQNALLPRILFPDKQPINTQKNFVLFTGRSLLNGTSVGVNIYGIAYAEFGMVGSCIFLFGMGMLFTNIIQWFLNKFQKTHNAGFLVFLPLIMLPFFSAEKELVGALNGLVKTAIFILFLIKALKMVGVR